ncbi:4357_t:CDS:2 [Acaulospora morrowiae]|uniref:4357_t:CDS:1 n=1 Tax=Acaulospora morrowiae TaxID=94023 RepID=A0A9N8W8W5_9GLOM|nr:4357_t:CDS:2 [Acaulospora morrowiae]
MAEVGEVHNNYLQGGSYEKNAHKYHDGISRRAFKRDPSALYKRQYDDGKVKRDADAFADEMARYGLVYMVKKRGQQKREASPLLPKKRLYERDALIQKRNTTTSSQKNLTITEILASYTDYSVPITVSYYSDEEKQRYLEELQKIFINPEPAKLNADGWPDKSVYDPANDLMFWWRNDPVANQHHEHWHLVMPSTIIDGVRKDREGENFVYMHRHMLSRYDADRLGCGLEIVKPLPDYLTPILEAFYPDPLLSQDNDSDPSTPRVWFPARPANESIKDIVQDMGGYFIIYTVKFLTYTYNELIKWIDQNDSVVHPVKLGWNDTEAVTLGSNLELILHNIGHAVLGYIMHPYSINWAPSVLVGARAGLRDPLFWRWHRHLDNIFLRWQNHLGPNDFLSEAPNVTIRTTDIYFSFTDVLLKVAPDGKKDEWQAYANKLFGGNYFDVDRSNVTVVTSELHTKMKNRILVWREDNFDKENITYVYPRDWQYFIRVKNNVDITTIITIRIFIVPDELADSPVHWIELDKFKRALKPYEKAVITRSCDKAVVIRKPAQKTVNLMDETQINATFRTTLTGYNDKEKAELLFCDCGWPYNMILPRGTKEGAKYKIIVFISDGLNDLVPTYDECGSTLLCGAQKWTDKIPDAKPLGYPFNRPFKNGSYEKTFSGLTNAAIRDFTIKLVDEDFPEV